MTPPIHLLLCLAAAVRRGRESAQHVGAGFLWSAWLDGENVWISAGITRFQDRGHAHPVPIDRLDAEARDAILDACGERLARCAGAA